MYKSGRKIIVRVCEVASAKKVKPFKMFNLYSSMNRRHDDRDQNKELETTGHDRFCQIRPSRYAPYLQSNISLSIVIIDWTKKCFTNWTISKIDSDCVYMFLCVCSFIYRSQWLIWWRKKFRLWVNLHGSFASTVFDMLLHVLLFIDHQAQTFCFFSLSKCPIRYTLMNRWKLSILCIRWYKCI